VRTLPGGPTAVDGPVLVHVVTTKGKGLPLTPRPEPGLAITPSRRFDPQRARPSRKRASRSLRANSNGVRPDPGEASASHDPTVVGITPRWPPALARTYSRKALPSSTSTSASRAASVTMASAMATAGLKPVWWRSTSTFLQRPFDQRIHDVGHPEAAVTFVLDRGRHRWAPMAPPPGSRYGHQRICAPSPNFTGDGPQRMSGRTAAHCRSPRFTTRAPCRAAHSPGKGEGRCPWAEEGWEPLEIRPR